MPEPVGKIIRIKNKFTGPPTLAVNTIGEGLQKHLKMCICCERLQPDSPEHCDLAEQLFEFSNRNAVATTMVRCANFEPKEQVRVSDSQTQE